LTDLTIFPARGRLYDARFPEPWRDESGGNSFPQALMAMDNVIIGAESP
jgi:hypothetical protein